MPTISSAIRSPTPESTSGHQVAAEVETNLVQRTRPSGVFLAGIPRRQRSDPDSSKGTSSPVFHGPTSLDPGTTYTSEEVDELVGRLEQFHVEKMQSLQGIVGSLEADVRDMQGELRALSTDLQTARENSDTLEDTNAHLLSDLEKARKTIGKLETTFTTMENQLKALNTDIDRKSDVIADQTRAIEKERGRVRDLKISREELSGRKDAEIADLHRQLEVSKAQIKDLQHETATLRAQRDAITTTASGVTPAKTEALVKSGHLINDEAAVLRELNTRLLSERKTLMETNAANLAENDRLKGQIVSLLERIGLDPSTL